MRLVGRPLQHRYPDRQLPSEGTTRGAIQVPLNGLPVILGPDHPVPVAELALIRTRLASALSEAVSLTSSQPTAQP